MPITCECAHCTTKFLAPDHFVGRQLPCPVCERPVRAPGDERAAPGPRAPSGHTVLRVEDGPLGAPGAGSRSLIDALDEATGVSAALSAAANWSETASPQSNEPAWTPATTSVGGRRAVIRLSRRAALAVAGAGFLALYSLILFSLPRLGIFLGVLIAIGGGVLIFSGMVWHLYVALREDTSCMVWALLVPPFAFYHMVSRWDRTRKAFLMMLSGALVSLAATGAIFLGMHLATPRRAPTAAELKEKAREPAGPKFKLDLGAAPSPVSPQASAAAQQVAPPAPKKPAAGESKDDAFYEPAKDLTTLPDAPK